jgi:hypothetical protein
MLEDRGDVLHAAYVAGKRLGFAPRFAIEAATASQSSCLAAGDDDVGAVCSQQSRDRLADAATGAGYEGNLAAEVKEKAITAGPLFYRSVSIRDSDLAV